MNFPFYIAKRYLVSKKSRNIINIISGISVVGVAVGTMALIVILSAFNGLDSLVKSLFNSFDPDIKIVAAQGKTFDVDSVFLLKIKETEGVVDLVEVIEEEALLQYNKRQHIGVIKGVSDNFGTLSGIDTMLIEGDYRLKIQNRPVAILGYGVAYHLSVGIDFIRPLKIYVPQRGKKVSQDPREAFNIELITPAGIFSVQQEYDTKYIIVPIEFAKKLTSYKKQRTALEIKVDSNFSVDAVKENLAKTLGTNFLIKNRYEQHILLYKIMKTEKWAIFLILSFILLIASFNVIASLTMLIIDKKKDIQILQSLGATNGAIRKIFLFEGWLISVVGAIAGLFLGATLCLIQIYTGIIPFQGDGFVFNSYPVELQTTDFFMVLGIVLLIGFFTAWYPVRNISQKHLS